MVMVSKVQLFLILTIFLASQTQSKEKTENDVPWRNVCLGGLKPEPSNRKATLEAFAKGPCSPIILFPGIGGSNLQIQIDCEKLKAGDPTTFQKCGWTTCESESKNPDSKKGNSSSPSKEYLVWVPHLLSPMTLFSPTEDNKDCFSGLAGLEYNVDGSKVTIKPKPGITVTPVGTTPETRDKNSWDCGFDGVINIIPDIPNPRELTYYATTKKRLEEMGYISGLTMQAIPYDFRADNNNDGYIKAVPQIIQRLYKFTQKKILLLGHSMGNHRISNLLWSMSQADKDKYLYQYIAAAPVLIGAAEVDKYFLCGSKEYFFPFHLGIDMRTFKKTLGVFSSMYQLLPNGCYSINAKEQWMQDIMKRIAYEKGQGEDPVYPWMPKRDEVCYEKYPDSNKCISGLFDYSKLGMILSRGIYDSNLQDILKEFSYSAIKDFGFNVIQDNNIHLPSFGIPTSIVYSTRVGTEGGHDFMIDPREKTSKDEFCNENLDFKVKWVTGDGTVPSAAAVTPWVKWAQEFDQKKAGSNPVKFVDVCSGVNQRGTPWDGKDQQGRNVMLKNEYQGIECNCQQGKVKDCTHIGMLLLDSFNDYLMNALKREETSVLDPEIEKMTEADVSNYVNHCDLFYEAYNPAGDVKKNRGFDFEEE